MQPPVWWTEDDTKKWAEVLFQSHGDYDSTKGSYKDAIFASVLFRHVFPRLDSVAALTKQPFFYHLSLPGGAAHTYVKKLQRGEVRVRPEALPPRGKRGGSQGSGAWTGTLTTSDGIGYKQ